MANFEFARSEIFQCVLMVAFGIAMYVLVISSMWMYCVCAYVLYSCLKIIRKGLIGTIAAKGQGVLITGCDTGFGHDLARRLDELGFTVFAGCLYPNGEGAKRLRSNSSRNLHIMPMDVGKDESVLAAHDYVVEHLPKSGLWAIVNNAGIGVLGDTEWLSVSLFNKVMNVNFYGAVRTITKFLYLIRKTKGRVVNVTSVRSMFPWPGYSTYHASKYALETMTDSLRLEMQKFGVGVINIRPGKYGNATGCRNPEHCERFWAEADHMWESASDDVKRTYGREYLDGVVKGNESAPRDTGSLTTRPVIDAMVHAIMSQQPCTSYTVDGVGKEWIDSHAMLARYHGCLPTWLTDWILNKWTNCDRFPDYCHLKKN